MRISEQPVSALAWYLRPLFWLQKRRFGQVLVPATVWARVPPLYAALTVFYAALDRHGSPLPPALRSFVQIRISQINECAFCIDLNAAAAVARGGSLDKAAAIADWRLSDLFSDDERLALAYAEAMTQSSAPVDVRLSEDVARRFGEAGLIELTALVGFQNLSSKFNAALDIPSQGFCRMPPAQA
jgi:AhpD family alkylhydroperoxidase